MVDNARQSDQLPPDSCEETLIPNDYQYVLVGRHIEGLRHEAIAERLSRSPGAVRMLWIRALEARREEIQRNESAFRN